MDAFFVEKLLSFSDVATHVSTYMLSADSQHARYSVVALVFCRSRSRSLDFYHCNSEYIENSARSRANTSLSYPRGRLCYLHCTCALSCCVHKCMNMEVRSALYVSPCYAVHFHAMRLNIQHAMEVLVRVMFKT